MINRFHSNHGEFVGWNRLLNMVPAFQQTIARKFFGHIPRKPWIPFAAAKAIDRLAQKDWRVWEVGAGYSTLWLADRVGQLTSIEASEDWYNQLKGVIEREGLKNVDLRFEWVGERMADFSELPDNSLDLLYIDGGPRDLCLLNGFRAVKPGGYVYLDNWDIDNFWPDARTFSEDHADEIEHIDRFVDYVPASVNVSTGLLIKKAETKSGSD